MELKVVFEQYARKEPSKRGAVHGASLALRRGGVTTMGELARRLRTDPTEISELRDIGPQRMEVIRQVLSDYERSAEERNG